MGLPQDVLDYAAGLPPERAVICAWLAEALARHLPEAEVKVWHGAPVWFLSGNPVAGYFNRKAHVQLLFWSGQSFGEPGLHPEGKFRAAEAQLTAPGQIDPDTLARWLAKARDIQWDYANIVKRKGRLEPLTPGLG